MLDILFVFAVVALIAGHLPLPFWAAWVWDQVTLHYRRVITL